MTNSKEIKAGILRISGILMPITFSQLITGKMKFVNKHLCLRSIRRIDGRVPFLETSYEFAFTADDLPVVENGLYPEVVHMEQVEGSENCYKLE